MPEWRKKEIKKKRKKEKKMEKRKQKMLNEAKAEEFNEDSFASLWEVKQPNDIKTKQTSSEEATNTKKAKKKKKKKKRKRKKSEEPEAKKRKLNEEEDYKHEDFEDKGIMIKTVHSKPTENTMTKKETVRKDNADEIAKKMKQILNKIQRFELS